MTIQVNGLFLGTLKPDATVAGCIDIFENVWPEPEKTIDIVEKESRAEGSNIYWEKASTIGQGVHQDIRTNSHMGVSHLANIADNGILQNIHNQFYTLLLSTTVDYANRYKIDGNLYHEGYNLLRYSGGQEYKSHYDSGTAMGRIISSIVYLNEDYEGGEIEFLNFGIKIKPKAGMMILFPSNFSYRHVAHPVTTGTKYALVTWIKDRQV
jgi:predicted 2-oxoglutarate/Fe(II)-dependent dioxygenase YbiX